MEEKRGKDGAYWWLPGRPVKGERRREASVVRLDNIPGCPVTPAELAARQLRMMDAMSAAVPVPQKMEIEDAIRAYARQLLAQRAAFVKSERITRTVHELMRAAGGEPMGSEQS